MKSDVPPRAENFCRAGNFKPFPKRPKNRGLELQEKHLRFQSDGPYENQQE
jgi:hypothetical protein